MDEQYQAPNEKEQPTANDSSENENRVPSEGKAAKPGAVTKELYDWLEIVAVAIAAVILVFTFVGRIATVDGTSMLPTLTNQERLIIREAFYKPKQGDIVICQSVSYGLEEPLVKRVIALEEQTVTIDFANWQVYVDGQPLQEDYIKRVANTGMHGWDYGQSYTVPKGHVFVMGDNRNNSQDSRRMSVGPIDERLVLGKAVCGISLENGVRFFD